MARPVAATIKILTMRSVSSLAVQPNGGLITPAGCRARTPLNHLWSDDLQGAVQCLGVADGDLLVATWLAAGGWSTPIGKPSCGLPWRCSSVGASRVLRPRRSDARPRVPRSLARTDPTSAEIDAFTTIYDGRQRVVIAMS